MKKYFFVFLFFLLAAPFQVRGADPFATSYGEVLGGQIQKAVTDFLAYKDAREKALPQLRGARGLLWACGDCPRRAEIAGLLRAILNDRDVFILSTSIAGVRPGGLQSGNEQFLYGSPYGEVPPKCRSRFDGWGSCVSRKGLVAGLGACLKQFNTYMSCRDAVEFKDNLPAFSATSLLGRLAFEVDRQNRYEVLSDFEPLYLAAMNLDSSVYNNGRGVMSAAAG